VTLARATRARTAAVDLAALSELAGPGVVVHRGDARGAVTATTTTG
jgi:hypothetical protein